MWIKYEKFQECYYTCGRIGHNKKSCREEKAMFVFNPKLPRYGPGLGVLAAMRLEAIQKENESRKERGQNCHKKEGAREVPLQQRAWHGKEKQLKEYKMDI